MGGATSPRDWLGRWTSIFNICWDLRSNLPSNKGYLPGKKDTKNNEYVIVISFYAQKNSIKYIKHNYLLEYKKETIVVMGITKVFDRSLQ